MVKKLLKHKVLCWLIPGGFFTILSTLFITILVTIGAFLIVQADGSNGSNGSVEGVVGNQNLSQGVKHYKKCLEEARALGNDRWTAVQSYNFGRNYNVYVAQNGKVHSTKLADQYSLKVVAPSLGNTTGQRYKYNDPIAVLYNGGWLYLNGGNFFYCDKVKQHITTEQQEGSTGSINSLDGVLGQTINGGECYGLTAYYVTMLGGPQLMGSNKWYVSQIGTDGDARAGDVINFAPGGYAITEYGHTGIVASVDVNGQLTIYEQNGEKGRTAVKYTRQWGKEYPITTSIVRKK